MKNSRKLCFEPNRVRVVNILTSSLSVRFLEGRAEYFEKKGFEVSVVSSPGEELARAQSQGVQTVAVPIAREISPSKDLISLWRLVRIISRLRPTITHVGTPKGGLLGGIAAWVCRVPCRFYSLYGLRCETTTGLKRRLLVLAERIACLCAHRVFCVSESLRQAAIDLAIVDAGRCFVPASGSCNGIDAERFGPTAEALCRADMLRWQLEIPRDAPVVGFVGRLTRDKGIVELVDAYLRLRKCLPKLRLLLVGEVEEADPLPSETRRLIERESQIIHTGFVEDSVPYYHVMDVLAFPTHREGFPNAVLEAHAAGKPIVAAQSTGVVDAVINGVTGILVPVGDARALADALQLVLEDQNLAATLGTAGRKRVLCEFRQETVWDAILQEYLQHLTVKGF
jgi:glycosyltransferase involved in cell wall biosynthesis